MKIAKKYAPLLSATLMGSMMAFIMSAVITAINLGGFPADFLAKWMGAFSLVVFIVVPVILLVRPIVEKIMSCIVDPN